MSIDACYILSAGYGTRMGDVGKILPKPLWPIFEVPLIKIIKEHFSELGITNFYANVHHGKDQLIPFLEANGITPLFEKELLLSGGAIHNIKKAEPSLKKIMTVNGDSFFYFSQKQFGKILKQSENKDVLLLALEVEKDEDYGRLIANEGVFKGITFDANLSDITYAGLSVIDLESLEYKEGPSAYFSSVSSAEKENSAILKLSGWEYWDFGTKSLYYENMFKLLKEDSDLKKMLIKKNYIQENKISNLHSYASSKENLINLSEGSFHEFSDGIVLSSKNLKTYAGKGIYFDEFYSSLSI